MSERYFEDNYRLLGQLCGHGRSVVRLRDEAVVKPGEETLCERLVDQVAGNGWRRANGARPFNSTWR